MLTAIVRSVLRFPAVVLCVAAIVLLYGVTTLLRANYDVFPEFVPPQAEIQVEAPGLAPEDVERRVTQPLENAINGGAYIAAVRSESIQGLAAINVVFEEDSDIFRDRQLLAERVAEAAPLLPAGVKPPVLGPLTSSTMDLLKVGFVSDKLSPIELRTWVDWTIRPRLLAVPGVARAIVYGGGRREVQIQVHPERLAAFNVSFNDIVTTATAATGVRGAGYIDTPAQRILLENVGVAKTPEEIARVVVSQREGANVRLNDVASVSYGAEPAFGDARVQGIPGVLLSLGSQYGANTLEVTRRVEAALAELMPALKAQGVNVYPALHRPANFIEVALQNMRDSLLLGALLVVVVLILFLRNWRTALISFVTIPLSLLIAVIVIHLHGWTINTMTLGGLAVAVGVVVDDAIIDVENIMRRLRLAVVHAGVSIEQIILDASIEVRRPIVLATFVVGFVFLPIVLLSGLQGSFFAPLATAFIIATLASLLVALTVTPALSLLLLRAHPERLREPQWVRRMKIWHRRVLIRCLGYGNALLVATIVFGVAAILALTRFGSELMPPFREGHFVAQVVAAPGTSLAEMTRMGERLSRNVLAVNGVATISQQVGRAESGEDTWSPNRCEFHIELQRGLSARRQAQIEAALRDVLAGFPGLQTELVTFLGDRISESLSGESAAVSVNVFGNDLDQLDTVAAQVAAALRSTPGATDVKVDTETGVPTLTIRPNAERLAAFGLRPVELYDAVAAAYSGVQVAQTYNGNQTQAVRVVLAPDARREPESVGQLLISTPAGRRIPLAAVADVSLDAGRGTIRHESGQRRQVVTANTTSSDLVGFVATAKQIVDDKVHLPAGIYVQFGGEAQGSEAATRDILINSIVAAVVIVLLLLLTFADGRSVALIVVNVPFALVGGVAAVALTNATLSIGSLVGLVTLFGISARNSIMLISHYEHLVKSEGMRWNRSAALRGARERLTPILMTALVTALGLLPLALGSGEAGREVEGPMAIVILGGLISSTLFNLFVMPALAFKYLRGARI